MLKLSWLGPPITEIAESQIHFETHKVSALLAYLSLNPRGCLREKLATLLWPESDQAHSLANFRRALGSLIHSLPAGYVEVNRETVRWNDLSPAQIDVLEFQSNIYAVRNHPHDEVASCSTCLNTLAAAADLYRGDFLDGFTLPDCSDFDDWQYFIREELKRDLAWILEQLVAGWSVQGAWDKAVRAARRWVNLDRLEAKAQLSLMDIYIHSGQRSQAQRQYDEYVRLSKEELGQEPDKETLKLFEQLFSKVQPIPMETKPVPPAALQGAPTLLKTKLYLPTIKTSCISRLRLLSKLEEVSQHKLTLISAPAGFGKTSLLADWIAQTEKLVGWLSLDVGDNDPIRFLTYLCAAIDNLVDGATATTQAMLESIQPVDPQSVIVILLNELEKIPESLVLVLDDYQFITNHPIHEACNYLLERATKNLHLVIASRADPQLQLARLRAQGDLLEIRTDDLRFTLSECDAFFHQVMKLDITSEDIQALATRTEGWAVGLQMAGISLRGATDPTRFIRTFSGSHRYILDYLMQEVLDQQPSYVRDFLLKTSILERMCSELCDIVVGESDEPSFIILDYLERSNLFLVPLDEERHWFRYHHLFADLLHARLKQTLKIQDIAALHTRAAQWYIHNELTNEAIHHASLTSNNEWVEQLIEQNYMEMFHRGEASSMRFWTGKLSKELIYRRPWLCIYEAQSHALFGQLDEAEVLLAKAEEHLQCENPSADTKSMLGHLAYVKSRVTGMRGDVHRAIELSLTARENTPASNQALQSGIGVMLGVGYFLNGDFINAKQIFNETIQSGIAANAINGTVAAYCHLARLYAIQGQLHRSYELYQEAGKFAHDAVGRNRGVMSIVDIGIANVLHELNDLEAALAHIKHSLEFIPLWGNADDIALAHKTHAQIQQAQGNMAGAVESIEKGIHLIQTSGVFSEARDAVRTAQVKLWLAQGDLPSAGHWAASQEERLISDIGFRFENELTRITLSRVYIAQKKPDETIRLLSRLEESAESGGRTERLIEILILKALTLQILGETSQALAALEKSLSHAEPERYIRIFMYEGLPIQRLIAQWSAHASDSPLRNYSLYLLSQFGAEPHQILETLERVSPTGDLVESLTLRELEVLQLIYAGDSNQAIANKLVISIKTVKKHTSNILGKLEVTSRAQAMVKARQLGLLTKDN